MPIIDDPRYTQSAIVGPVRSDLFTQTPAEEEKPGFLETAAAASRQATLPGAAYSRFVENPDPDLPDAPPGYDALDNIQGYEQYAARFVRADTPSEVAGIKSRIDAELADRDVLKRAGLGGPAAEIAMNLLDPSFLAAAAVPELAIAKAGRIGKAINAAVQGAAGAAAYETGMQSIQENRSLGESGFNIAGGALLGGVLGSLGKRVPREQMESLQQSIRSEVGAAAAMPQTTLAQESLARGGETLSNVAAKVPFAQTDLQVVLRSDSLAARQILQELADVTPLLAKNEQGIATSTSIESLVGRHEGRVADLADYLGTQWTKYRARLKAADSSDFPLPRDERLTKQDFYAAVASASRQGDRDLVPEVAEAAKYLRSRVFDPLKSEAQRLGLLPADVEVVGAESYFRRMYDRNAIRANRKEWDNIITQHFMRQGHDYAEARSVAEDISRRILGADVGQANFNVRTHLPAAGPLHERVLTVPDELIEKFLVSDPIKVAHAYVRELAPEIEVTKRFGDKDMKHAFDRVREEYDVLRERVRAGVDSSAKLSDLGAQEQRTLEALTRIRDRVYGRAGRLSADAGEGERMAVQLARGWRNFVAAGRLGVTALTGGLMDASRIVATYGFTPTISKLTKLATSPAFRGLSKDNARRLGAAVEVALARRVNVAFDGAVTEGWTQTLANSVYKYTGLNHITDFNRMLAASLVEDEALKAAADVAAGRALKPFTKTRLASLGLDADALRAIHRESVAHGANVEGVYMSGSGNWSNAELAAKYDAAILKEARTLVMQPGAADRTWWMDSETGKVLGQLKSFALSTPMRMSITPFQLIGQGEHLRAARFIGAMLVGGYLTHALRQTIAGKKPTTDATQAANEAFTEAGLGGIVPDLVSPIGRRFGLFGESARFSDRNVLSTFGGPALGTLGDAYDLAFNRTANGMSARDLQLLRRLTPWQNVWWLRRAINALEGEAAEAMDLKGADVSTFGERFLETKPLLSTTERGGTGTGQVVQ